MVVHLFDKALEPPQVLTQPLIKANQLFATNLEQMVVFQMNTLKSYLDISINQMKAAAEISSIETLQDFYKRQAEIGQALQQKLMTDAKEMTEMVVRFKTEMDHLAQATLEDVLPKAA